MHRDEHPVYYAVSVSLIYAFVINNIFSLIGEKPYPCTFCGRRFRTNYNKLGHEKKCPDRHARALLQPTGQTENGGPTSGPPPAVPQPTPAAVPNAVYR